MEAPFDIDRDAAPIPLMSYHPSPPPSYTLPPALRSHMEEVRPLGKGGFGSVGLVRSRLDGRLVAVKQVMTLPRVYVSSHVQGLGLQGLGDDYWGRLRFRALLSF